MKLPLPQSLTAQFTLVVSCLAALVVAVGATTIYSLAGSAHAIRQLAEERLARQEEAQDLAQHTLMIERMALQLSSDDTVDAVRETHRHIIEQLASFDTQVDRLASATASTDVGVDALALHRSSQLFRNTVNIEAQVRETALGAGAAPRPGASLASLDDDMRRQVDALTVSARQQSDYFTRDYREAVQDLAEHSERTQWWVAGEVAMCLLLAWLIARVFLDRHIVARLRQVSHALRHGDVDSVQAGVPVHGGDEIADMARAVEQFLEDRRQRRQAEDALQELNAGLEARVAQRTAELSAALAGQTAEIVERQHAEEAARASEHFLNSIIENIPDMIFVKDAATLRFVRFNHAGEQLLGYRREELIGKSVHDLFPAQEADFFALKDRAVLDSRQMVDVPEEPVHTRHGLRLVHTMKIPIVDVRGEPQFLLGISRDITEQKRADEELQRHREHLEDMILERTAELAVAKEQADAANRAKSDFLANMSHELRTPLNGILGYAQMLRRDRTLDERHLEAVGVIQQSGEQLLTLINDLLDFAKIEAGKLELSLDDLALADFLRTIAGIISVRAEQKDLEFICDVAPDLPRGIRADPGRLRQILLNLLTNAVKFTDRGQVRLRLRFLPPSRLRFEVQDSGIGISADHLETIFEPFEQVSDPQRRLGGAGLGLPISRHLVRLMGGEIHVTSEVGVGSTFWFELDVPVIETMVAAPPEPTVTGYQGPRKEVLVVDDIAANRAVAVSLLSQLGFDVTEAVNGREALDKAQARRPDWILMDVVMPEMDGLEATRRLRQLPGLEEVPVIAMSASASRSDEQKSMAAGANAFLSKPIDVPKLLAQIAILLKIVWTYELPEAQPAAEREALGTLVAPPPQEMETLHRLALLGDMRAIARHAAHLSDLDEQYRPFADRLRLLAKGYQSQAIRSLVERYLEGKPTP